MTYKILQFHSGEKIEKEGSQGPLGITTIIILESLEFPQFIIQKISTIRILAEWLWVQVIFTTKKQKKIFKSSYQNYKYTSHKVNQWRLGEIIKQLQKKTQFLYLEFWIQKFNGIREKDLTRTERRSRKTKMFRLERKSIFIIGQTIRAVTISTFKFCFWWYLKMEQLIPKKIKQKIVTIKLER